MRQILCVIDGSLTIPERWWTATPLSPSPCYGSYDGGLADRGSECARTSLVEEKEVAAETSNCDPG